MLLIGLERIATYMDCSVATIKIWEQKEAFPVSDLPDGTRVTSSGLIDDWLYERILNPGAKRLRRIERRNRGGNTFGPRDPSYPPYEKRGGKPVAGEAGQRDASAGQQAVEQGAVEVHPEARSAEQPGEG